MSRAFEEFYNDGVKRAEIRAEKRRDTAVVRRMLGAGLPYEQIEQFTGLSLERIREIEAECKND